MLRVAVVIAGLLCSSAQARQRTEPPPAPDGSDAGSTERTLSKEDAELLKNLELFEEPKQPEKSDQRQQ